MNVRIVLSGRGYDAAAALPLEWQLPEQSTLADALEVVRRQLPAGRELPSSCLVAVSGVHVGTVGRHASRTLRDGEEIVLIAPVAGG